MTRGLLYLFILVLFIISCNQKSIDLPDFDESAWRADKDGCNDVRGNMRDDLIKVKAELKGLNSGEITNIFGKPNKITLADRNQKYFIYHISCPTEGIEPSTLSIRFSAVGLSYEVIVY